jgi:hypothetical protein
LKKDFTLLYFTFYLFFLEYVSSDPHYITEWFSKSEA